LENKWKMKVPRNDFILLLSRGAVTCNCHHGLVAGLGFGEFRDRVVVKVVETESIGWAQL
jgi:hypothetical protein